MSKDEKKRNIKIDISKNILRNKDMAVHCSDLPQKRKKTNPQAHLYGSTDVSPTTATSHKERGKAARGTSAKNSGEGKKPSIMQKALKVAAMFALAIGTGAMSSDSQAQAMSNIANIRSGADVETQVLQEQDKRRKFLSNKSGTKFTNRIVRTNMLRINPEVLNAVQNTVGKSDGLLTAVILNLIQNLLMRL